MGDDGARAFAQSLKVVNEALNNLDLGYNEIKDEGAFALAQALKANAEGAVALLSLSSNYITKLGAVALTEAVDIVHELGSGKDTTIVF